LAIQSVNSQVNADHDYETDQSGYGVGEQWEIMGPGDTGDCEDFALTKMQALIDAGYSVANLQLSWGQTETGGNHAFLIIQTSNRGTLVLDNRFSNVMQIEKVPYRFQAYQRAGQGWANYTAQLTGVAIEYMNCHAAAFADGDEVIIEFEGQDWNAPKVIGFKSDPQGCTLRAWVQSSAAWYQGVTNWIYAPLADVFTEQAEMSDPGRFAAASFSDLQSVFVVAGTDDDDNYTTNEKLDIALDMWEVKTQLGYATAWVGGFYLDGFGYVVGGRRVFAVDDADNNVNRYSVAGDSWDTATVLPVATARMRTWQIDGFGYVVGGEADEIGVYLSAIRKYDPTLNSWAAAATLSTGLYDNLSFTIGTKGYAVAGIQQVNLDGLNAVNDGYYATRANSFDSTSQTLGLITDYPHRLWNKSAVGADGAGSYTDGYCFGGERHLGVNPEKVTIYNQAGNSWSLGAQIPYINEENDPPAGTSYLMANAVEAIQ